MCKGLEVHLSGVFGKPGASLLSSLLSTGNRFGVAWQVEQLGLYLNVMVDMEAFAPSPGITATSLKQTTMLNDLKSLHWRTHLHAVRAVPDDAAGVLV